MSGRRLQISPLSYLGSLIFNKHKVFPSFLIQISTRNPNNYNSRSKLMCTSLLLRMKRRVLFRDSLNRAKGVRRTLLHESPPSLPPKCRKVPRDRLSRLFPLNLYPWSSPP
ncbi:hypothetical protein BKA93DRAFT_86197 [Sparassis latifolia]